LFDFKTKSLKCSGDQIPSGGHSAEERVKTNQIIAVNPDFHGIAVRFLCDDQEIESDLLQKAVVLGFGSKDSHECGSSTYPSSIRISSGKCASFF
jgi:hypothetical protein